MYAVIDVILVLQYTFYLCNRPHILLGFLCSLKYMGKGAVSLEIEPCRSGYSLLNEKPCDFSGSRTMNGKVKYLFDNPLCFLIHQQMPGLVRVFDIADGSIGSVMGTICKAEEEKQWLIRIMQKAELIKSAFLSEGKVKNSEPFFEIIE